MKTLRLAIFVGVILLLAGCATESTATPVVLAVRGPGFTSRLLDNPGPAAAPTTAPTTGRVLTRTDMLAALPHAFLGDRSYAEVNSRWLSRFYDFYRSELFNRGIRKWDARFTCRHFAAYYVSVAQARYFLETFHYFQKANSLAIGTVWYVRSDGSGHALVVALTERGRLFLDPQTGEEVSLTPSEEAHAFLEVF